MTCTAVAVGWSYDAASHRAEPTSWGCSEAAGHEGPHVARVDWTGAVDHASTQGWWIVMPRLEDVRGLARLLRRLRPPRQTV